MSAFDIAALQYLRRQLDDYDDLQHEGECVCWRCVLKLNAEIAQHQARMRVKYQRKDGWF